MKFEMQSQGERLSYETHERWSSGEGMKHVCST